RPENRTRHPALGNGHGHDRFGRTQDVLHGRRTVRHLAFSATDRLEARKMMERLAATRVAVELAGEAPIIGGVGNGTFDLIPFDRPRNFYMWNSMGMASSIGLGLALARRDLRVVILDGDGSILMNLSSLATERTSGVS